MCQCFLPINFQKGQNLFCIWFFFKPKCQIIKHDMSQNLIVPGMGTVARTILLCIVVNHLLISFNFCLRMSVQHLSGGIVVGMSLGSS